MLITKYKIKQIRILKDLKSDIVIDEVSNLHLEKDLILHVRNNGDKVILRLQSTRINLKELVCSALENFYNTDEKNKLTFVGKEDFGTYDYPEAMTFLTYVLVNTYHMTKLKILNKKSLPGGNAFVSEEEKKESENQCKTDTEILLENVDAINRDLKNVFLLECCKEQRIENDIYLDIDRFNQCVVYTFTSETSDLKEFFKKCMDIYKHNMTISEYKHSLRMVGREISDNRDSETHVHYSKELIALNYKLIKENYVNHYRLVTHRNQQYKMIDSITNLKFDNITLNIMKKVQTKIWDTSITTTFILESNDVDLEQYINDCLKEHTEEIAKSTYQKLFYFKYLGVGATPSELKFSTTILSEPSNISVETFDNMYSEHVQDIKKDILRLKDMNYYKRTGMRRKKSYLFYGDPGTGKNAMITAIALFDERHIIDIPFDKIRTNHELDALMNISNINGVEFRKDQIIIMFDEIHVGLERFCYQKISNQTATNTNTNINYSTEIITENCKNCEECTVPPSILGLEDELTIGNVLSLFDGSQNYNGIIFVGLTNYIDKICEPLKRPGRLTPKYFTYMRQSDVKHLLENFFQLSLTEDQIEQIPNRKITPANLRILCELHEETGVDSLIKKLTDFKPEEESSYMSC